MILQKQGVFPRKKGCIPDLFLFDSRTDSVITDSISGAEANIRNLRVAGFDGVGMVRSSTGIKAALLAGSKVKVAGWVTLDDVSATGGEDYFFGIGNRSYSALAGYEGINIFKQNNTSFIRVYICSGVAGIQNEILTLTAIANQAYYIEVEWDYGNNSVSYWLDGVLINTEATADVDWNNATDMWTYGCNYDAARPRHNGNMWDWRIWIDDVLFTHQPDVLTGIDASGNGRDMTTTDMIVGYRDEATYCLDYGYTRYVNAAATPEYLDVPYKLDGTPVYTAATLTWNGVVYTKDAEYPAGSIHNLTDSYIDFMPYELMRTGINSSILNMGGNGTTDFVDSNTDGLADNISDISGAGVNATHSIISGGGFTGNAQRFEATGAGTYMQMQFNSPGYAKYARIEYVEMEYRSDANNIQVFYSGGAYATILWYELNGIVGAAGVSKVNATLPATSGTANKIKMILYRDLTLTSEYKMYIRRLGTTTAGEQLDIGRTHFVTLPAEYEIFNTLNDADYRGDVYDIFTDAARDSIFRLSDYPLALHISELQIDTLDSYYNVDWKERHFPVLSPDQVDPRLLEKIGVYSFSQILFKSTLAQICSGNKDRLLQDVNGSYLYDSYGYSLWTPT